MRGAVDAAGKCRSNRAYRYLLDRGCCGMTSVCASCVVGPHRKTFTVVVLLTVGAQRVVSLLTARFSNEHRQLT
jgi:hypothetical protein